MADKKKTGAPKAAADRKKPVHVPGGQRVTLHQEDGRRLQLILTPAKEKFFARAVLQNPTGELSEKGKPTYSRKVVANKQSDDLGGAQSAYQEFINDAGAKGWSTKNAGAPLHDFAEIPA